MAKIEGSSQISDVDYHADSQTLSVTFHGGKQYSYSPVSPSTHASLMQAESKGSFFGRHVKGNKSITCTPVNIELRKRVR